MRRHFLLALLLAVVLAPSYARAQTMSAPATQPVIRYHFGDNPAWAAPSFNDSAWPVAKNGHWPLPPLHSDGFVWVRMQIPVPTTSNTELAAMLQTARNSSQQLYLQGKLIGQSGQLPPHPAAVVPFTSVFAVPPGLAAAPVATIALRIWYPLNLRYIGREDHASVRLGPASLLQSAQHAKHLSGILDMLPLLVLDAILGLVGVGLFILWYWSRSRELFWFSLLLITYPSLVVTLSLPVFSQQPPHAWISWVTLILADCMGMPVSVEFLRTIFNIRTRWFRIILHLSWMIFLVGFFVGRVGLNQASSPLAVAVFLHVEFFMLAIFNYGTLLTSLRYLISGPNRPIAFGLALIPLGAATSHLGISITLFHIPLFNLGFILAGFAIAALLIRQAIEAWRQGDRLRGEIDAAREVQQRLVPQSLPLVKGLELSAVYLPAAEVGGDFYQVFPLPDGSALVVVADVSGKGLKAAMTGTVALGALRLLAEESRSPGIILTRLNTQIAKASDGGFITCLCAHITPNGTLTVANAGHLSPYRNGEEIPVDSGLPLGITEASEYTERSLQLNPGDTLTFLSDGVIEARNPEGELYGFDRTRAISTQSAQQIAETAQQFGQEDDITVLTLKLTPPEAALPAVQTRSDIPAR